MTARALAPGASDAERTTRVKRQLLSPSGKGSRSNVALTMNNVIPTNVVCQDVFDWAISVKAIVSVIGIG